MTDSNNSQMDAKRWIAVAGTMLGAFMAVLDIQITNSSLNDISGGISVTPDEGSWISTSYLIGEIITIPLTAWLSRIFTVCAATCSSTSCSSCAARPCAGSPRTCSR